MMILCLKLYCTGLNLDILNDNVNFNTDFKVYKILEKKEKKKCKFVFKLFLN